MIMQTFNIGPSAEIGTIKSRIKEAILEGEIPNQEEDAIKYMLKLAEELGLKKVKDPINTKPLIR
jgi:tRNA nucleotidyltransferase (CCA-adding enzyme)